MNKNKITTELYLCPICKEKKLITVSLQRTDEIKQHCINCKYTYSKSLNWEKIKKEGILINPSEIDDKYYIIEENTPKEAIKELSL